LDQFWPLALAGTNGRYSPKTAAVTDEVLIESPRAAASGVFPAVDGPRNVDGAKIVTD
jgi:hypothetical protein